MALPQLPPMNSGLPALPPMQDAAPAGGLPPLPPIGAEVPALPPLALSDPPDLSTEDLATQQWDRITRFGKMFGENFLGVFTEALPALLADKANLALSVDRGQLKESLGEPFADIPKGPIESAVGKTREWAFENLQQGAKESQAIAQSGPQGLTDDLLNTAAQSTGRMAGEYLAALPFGLATKTPMLMPTLMALYADAGVQKQGEYEAAGLEQDTARGLGRVQGGIEALTEALGLKIGGKLVDDVLFKQPGVLKEFAKFIAADWTWEQVATVLGSLTDKTAYGKTWDEWTAELKEQAPVSILAPFVTSGIQLAGMKVTSASLDKMIEVANAQLDKAWAKKTADFMEFPPEYIEARDKLYRVGEELKAAVAERDAAKAAMDARIAAEAATAPPWAQYNNRWKIMEGGLAEGEARLTEMPIREGYEQPIPAVDPIRTEFQKYVLTEDPAGAKIQENLLQLWDTQQVKPGVYVADTANLRKQLEGELNPALPTLPPKGQQTSTERRAKLDARSQRRTAQLQLDYIDFATKQIREWQQMYLPDSTIVLNFEQGADPGAYGSNWYQPAQGQQEVQLLNLNLPVMIEGHGYSKSYMNSKGQWVRETDAVPLHARMSMYQTAAHEFGHALTMHYFKRKMPLPAKNALIQAYVRDVLEAAKLAESRVPGYTSTIDNVALQGANIGLGTELSRLAMPRSTQWTFKSPSNKQRRSLEFGTRMTFIEWLAHQTARDFSQKEAATDPVGRLISPFQKAIRHFYRKNRKVWAPNETFKTFVDEIFASNKVKALEDQQLAAALEHYKALKKMRDNPPEVKLVDMMGRIATGRGIKIPGVRWLPKEMQKGIPQAVDSFNWFMKHTISLLNLGDRNPWIAGLKYSNRENGEGYIPAVQRMQDIANHWKQRAQEITVELINTTFKGGRRENFNRFIFDVSQLSDELSRALTPEELEQKRVEHGLLEQDIAVANKMWSFYRDAITRVEEIRKVQLHNALLNGTITQQDFEKEMAKIKQSFDEMRDKNYMPYQRFGKYAIHVTSLKDKYRVNKYYTVAKAGGTVAFERYENWDDWQKALKEIENGKYGRPRDDVMIAANEIEDDPGMAMLGFDQRLVKIVLDGLKLSPEDRAKADEMLLKLNPTEGFRKKLIERAGVPGYSDHAIRVFSDYAVKFSNFLSRLETIDSIDAAIEEMEDSYKNPVHQMSPKAQLKRSQIVNWVKRHKEYIMKPENELAGLRAAAFLYYLGAVPKAALVNVSQIPVVAYPYLAAAYGDRKALQALTTGMKDVVAHLTSKKAYAAAEQQMMDDLGGLLNESFAAMLGALQEGSILQKVTGGKFVGSESAAMKVQQIQDLAGFLFSASEQFNRRIVALAAYRLSMEKYGDQRRATNAARQAVEKTQFEYARYNRPQLLRGKKSVFFLFQQYVLSMLYFMGKSGEGRSRYLLMMLLLAGAEGFPGAGNLMDMVDWLATKWKTHFGWTNPKVQVRAELRKFIEDLYNANPEMPGNSDLWMRGLSSQIPVPWTGASVDLSGSIGFGRPIPGTDLLNRTNLTPLEKAARMGGEVAGAAGAIPLNFLTALGSDDPNTLKAFERAMPTALANISKAWRFAKEGEATDPQGDAIINFDTSNPAHLAEIAMQGLGFTPTRLATARDKQWLVKEKIDFYTAQRSVLIKEAWQLYQSQPKAKAGELVGKMVSEYNARVPHPAFAVSGKDIEASFKARLTRSALKDMGYGPEKRYADYYEQEMINLGGPSSGEARTLSK